MRIISGEWRGRRIQSPPGKGTRPMLDRVREACFSTLGDRVIDARVLDLFAGTGSLGLEALSRGADRARFFERHRPTARLLSGNADEFLGEPMPEASDGEPRAQIISGDALNAAGWLHEDPDSPTRWIDLVFLDPPYPFLKEPKQTALLEKAVLHLTTETIVPDGRLIFHTPKRSTVQRWLPEEDVIDTRDYGSSRLWYLRGRAEVEA